MRVYGVEHADFQPKPDHSAFQKIFELDELRPEQAAMFEDDPRNLRVPHQMGMRTIHVAPSAAPRDYIHYHTDNLSSFLSTLV